MRVRKKINHYLFSFLGIWWSVLLLIIVMQGWFLLANPLFIPLSIVISFLFYRLWQYGYRCLLSRSFKAEMIFQTFAWIHVVPLFFQIVGIIESRFDNIFLGIIGLLIFLLLSSIKDIPD